MPFFYDRVTGQSGLRQYSNYLDNEIYLSDLKRDTKDAINYQLIEVRKLLGRESEQSLESFNKLTNEVCGTFERGFNAIEGGLTGIKGELTDIKGELTDVNWRLNDINETIDNLHTMLDWKTDLLIEGQKITNLYLGKVIKMLKIPDSQKQRGYHVEQGVTYLKNAIMEGAKSDFYSDAIDEFSKAQQIEERDFFCLHKLGLIHLNSLQHLDVKKAEEYFRLSARYAKAAVNANQSEGQNNASSEKQLLQETASALIFASKANYILDNLSDGIALAKQAIQIQPLNLDFKVHLAKCLSSNGQDNEAKDILIEVIKIDKFYSVKVLTDPDFVSKSTIVAGINLLCENLTKSMEEQMNSLKFMIKDDSVAKADFEKLEQIFSKKTYLAAREIEYEFLKDRHWEYRHYENKFFEEDHYRLPSIDRMTINATIPQIIGIEVDEAINKKAWEINYNTATQLINNSQKKEKNKKLTFIIFKAGITLLLAILLWLYTNSMDGWFLSNVIRIGIVIGIICLLPSIFGDKKENE